MDELLEKANKCTTCLEWKEICKAECCSSIFFNVDIDFSKIRHQVQLYVTDMDDELRHYLDLHGIPIINDTLILRKSKLRKSWQGITKYVGRCRYLSDDFLCKAHNTNEQPDICKYPNINGTREDVRLTPNCLFQYKYGEKKNGKEN